METRSKKEKSLEYLVISSITTNLTNMLILILMLKISFWWLFSLQWVIENVTVFWDTLYESFIKIRLVLAVLEKIIDHKFINPICLGLNIPLILT